MNWKVKSLIQNSIALMPKPLANKLYFRIQRNFGGLQSLDPMRWIEAGYELFGSIREQGFEPDNKIFFEVGTGRSPILPLAYWLQGAQKIITVDLNHYLQEEVLAESLKILCQKKNEVEKILGSSLKKERFYTLIEMMDHPFDLQKFFELTQIDYRAPSDARQVNLPDASIDFHTSFTVLEHIPPQAMEEVLIEGHRLLKNDGLFVHLIDYSDHFSHTDSSINSLNFLQYSDTAWRFFAGNRFMYMNRLRHDDFVEVFKRLSTLLKVTPYSDAKVLELIKSGQMHVDKKFKAKSLETLAITHALIIAKK